MCVLLWASGMGIVPSLIYGFSGKAGHRSEEEEVIPGVPGSPCRVPLVVGEEQASMLPRSPVRYNNRI